MTHYAFFDVDGTLLKTKSMIDFQKFIEKSGELPVSFRSSLRKWILEFSQSFVSRERLNAIYYQQYAGLDVERIETLGRDWFKALISWHAESIWIPSAIERLRSHRGQGHRVVLVSGSFRACLEPIATHLGVEDILCANLEARNGKYTGRLIPPQTIGDGKAEAIQAFLRLNGTPPAENVWAYGDHHSDIPMLKQAASPFILLGDPKLEAYAHQHGWGII
jgi:HAD superfamily hydrolase (TIGR01490 family)